MGCNLTTVVYRAWSTPESTILQGHRLSPQQPPPPLTRCGQLYLRLFWIASKLTCIETTISLQLNHSRLSSLQSRAKRSMALPLCPRSSPIRLQDDPCHGSWRGLFAGSRSWLYLFLLTRQVFGNAVRGCLNSEVSGRRRRWQIPTSSM